MKQIILLLLAMLPLFAFSQSKQSDEYFNKGVELYNAGKYKEAIPYFEKSNELDIQELDESDARRYYSIHWLSNCYYKLGKEETATELYPDEYSVTPVDRRLTVESDALANKVDAAMNDGDYNAAIRYLKKMIQIEKSVEGENHPWVANDYHLMGICLNGIENYEEAEKYIKLYVDIYEKNFGVQSLQYASAIVELAALYNIRHNFASAVQYSKKADEIYKKQLGSNNEEYIINLNKTATYYHAAKDYENAILAQKEVLALSVNFDIEPIDILTLRNNLANYFKDGSKHKEALAQYESNMAYADKFFGDKSIQHAQILCSMAQVYYNMSNYKMFQETEQRALELLESKYPNSELHIYCLLDFADYYIGFGSNDFKDYATKAYTIIKNSNLYKQTDEVYIATLDKIIHFYSSDEDFQSALKYSNELLKCYELKYGKSSLDYIYQSLSYALIVRSLGNFDLAVSIEKENINKLESIGAYVADCYEVLGVTYQTNNDFISADKAFEKAMKIAQNNNDTLTIVSIATHYARNYLYMMDLAKAYELLCDEVIVSYMNKFNMQSGIEKLQTVQLWLSLASINRDMIFEYIRNNNLLADLTEKTKKQLQNNLLLLDNALGMFYSELKGKSSPAFKQFMYEEALDYMYLGNNNKAIENIPLWFNYISNNVRNNFSTMTSKERQMFSNQFVGLLGHDLLLFPYKTQNPKLITIAYDGQLFSKGLTLNAELEIQKLIEKSGDKQMKEKYLKIRTDRALLDKLYQMPVSKRTINADSLQNEIEKNEKELVASSKEIGDYTKNLSITWQSVQNKLKNNDIAIEFGQFYDDDNSLTTIALVLKKGMSSPKLVKLDFTETDSINYKTSKLYNHIWKPLEKYLAGVKNVYLSPCGKFHTIGIEYLPDENGEIFAKKFNAYRLSSTRELALEKEINPNKKASVYGGILYDFSEGDWQDLKDYKDEIEQEFRDIPDLSGSFRAGVTFLQGAKVESETITEILRNGNYKVSDWAETYATEESFKKLSGSGINMLHIATHGFYEPESKQNSFTDYLSGSKNNKEDLSLSRSGLLLAGAASAIDPEKRKQIPEGVDDGILTAKEISRLDFKGLDLVVLSACQTGLGEVTGEGVFGLQRGFKKAGAQTIVMSLWKVDDNATKDLMTEFYKNLVQGKSKREAFVLAQDFVRQKYQDPQKWAAFIMVDGL